MEVFFDSNPGTFEETANDRVMVRLNDRHEVTGFSVRGLTQLEQPYLDIVLETTPLRREA